MLKNNNTTCLGYMLKYCTICTAVGKQNQKSHYTMPHAIFPHVCSRIKMQQLGSYE